MFKAQFIKISCFGALLYVVSGFAMVRVIVPAQVIESAPYVHGGQKYVRICSPDVCEVVPDPPQQVSFWTTFQNNGFQVSVTTKNRFPAGLFYKLELECTEQRCRVVEIFN